MPSRWNQAVIFKRLPKSVVDPPIIQEAGPFVVKLAENAAEIDQALHLRYRVFNLEQGKGLDSAVSSEMDTDEFDEVCLHLIVVERETTRVVGTYRLHPGVVAGQEKGFYSAREFDIAGIGLIGDQCLELGRSCVDPEFRQGAAVSLLWLGVAEVLMRSRLRYLLGCVSLETVDPVIGWAIFHHLIRKDGTCPELAATPRPGFVLPSASTAEVEATIAKGGLQRHIPPLFKGYLRIGAKICGEPAIDREFGTIDFLILVDTSQLPARYRRHFNYTCKSPDVAG
jgi:putative hemolysin